MAVPAGAFVGDPISGFQYVSATDKKTVSHVFNQQTLFHQGGFLTVAAQEILGGPTAVGVL